MRLRLGFRLFDSLVFHHLVSVSAESFVNAVDYERGLSGLCCGRRVSQDYFVSGVENYVSGIHAMILTNPSLDAYCADGSKTGPVPRMCQAVRSDRSRFSALLSSLARRSGTILTPVEMATVRCSCLRARRLASFPLWSRCMISNAPSSENKDQTIACLI